MKIRRKVPKPSRSARPSYIVGYSVEPPDFREIHSWFDLQYGGPLMMQGDRKESTSQHADVVRHGPWIAAVRLSLPNDEAEGWKTQLNWRHNRAATVTPIASTPHEAVDTVLFAARLARGLVLLTQGTAYDAAIHSYSNPSDWTDRSLMQFQVVDHVDVVQRDAEIGRTEWFFTRGLSKFGLDELEVFRPVGLPAQPVVDRLLAVADEIIRSGRSPNVGTAIHVPSERLSVRVVRHRTAFPDGASLTVRELTWEPA